MMMMMMMMMMMVVVVVVVVSAQRTGGTPGVQESCSMVPESAVHTCADAAWGQRG